MTDIHPSAVIDAKAELGAGVKIGAFSIIEGNVSIGDGTIIEPHVVVRNYTNIGKNNHIYQFSSIGEDPQYAGYKAEDKTVLTIGDNNTIREYCTLNRGTKGHGGATIIGSDNFIMAYVHIAHDCVLGNNTIFANGASLAGHVEVGDYAILGGFSLVHQFCKVGAHCITGIGAICFQDVPPFIVAAGNSAKPFGINIKGLRRRDFDDETVALLRQSYKLLYRHKLDLKSASNAIEALAPDNPRIQEMVAFLARSDRGIIR